MMHVKVVCLEALGGCNDFTLEQNCMLAAWRNLAEHFTDSTACGVLHGIMYSITYNIQNNFRKQQAGHAGQHQTHT